MIGEEPEFQIREDLKRTDFGEGEFRCVPPFWGVFGEDLWEVIFR